MNCSSAAGGSLSLGCTPNRIAGTVPHNQAPFRFHFGYLTLGMSLICAQDIRSPARRMQRISYITDDNYLRIEKANDGCNIETIKSCPSGYRSDWSGLLFIFYYSSHW